MPDGGVFRLVPGRSICLASASPRRKKLLADLGIAPEILVSDYEEQAPGAGEDPRVYAARNAKAKCMAAAKMRAQECVLAADTVVSRNGEIFGKPANEQAALAMLLKLNNGWHEVSTAVYIIFSDRDSAAFPQTSRVHFADWPEDILRAYIRETRPLDKAGSYGLQDLGGFLIDKLEGSVSNIIGLPLFPLIHALLAKGVIEANISA